MRKALSAAHPFVIEMRPKKKAIASVEQHTRATTCPPALGARICPALVGPGAGPFVGAGSLTTDRTIKT